MTNQEKINYLKAVISNQDKNGKLTVRNTEHADIVNAVNTIDPFIYADWEAVGTILKKRYAEKGFDLFVMWSTRGDIYMEYAKEAWEHFPPVTFGIPTNLQAGERSFLVDEGTNVMLDLETLGTSPGSAILSIGAVKFGNGGIQDRFYARIDLANNMRLSLRIDASTIMWWLKQSDEARLEITEPGGLLVVVLLEFDKWLGTKECKIWGNGAAFDNALLAEAYRVTELELPWQFRNDRCYRTLKNFFPQVPLPPGTGTKHNALDDAEFQAKHLMAIFDYQRSMQQDLERAHHLAHRIHMQVDLDEVGLTERGPVELDTIDGELAYFDAKYGSPEMNPEDPTQGKINLV